MPKHKKKGPAPVVKDKRKSEDRLMTCVAIVMGAGVLLFTLWVFYSHYYWATNKEFALLWGDSELMPEPVNLISKYDLSEVPTFYEVMTDAADVEGARSVGIWVRLNEEGEVETVLDYCAQDSVHETHLILDLEEEAFLCRFHYMRTPYTDMLTGVEGQTCMPLQLHDDIWYQYDDEYFGILRDTAVHLCDDRDTRSATDPYVLAVLLDSFDDVGAFYVPADEFDMEWVCIVESDYSVSLWVNTCRQAPGQDNSYFLFDEEMSAMECQKHGEQLYVVDIPYTTTGCNMMPVNDIYFDVVDNQVHIRKSAVDIYAGMYFPHGEES